MKATLKTVSTDKESQKRWFYLIMLGRTGRKQEMSKDKKQFDIGDKVTYTAPHGEKQNGIVKRLYIENGMAWVVYNCNNQWNRFNEYTAAKTDCSQLSLGWE